MKHNISKNIVIWGKNMFQTRKEYMIIIKSLKKAEHLSS